MKKVFSIIVVIFIASGSFAQNIDVKDLKASECKTLIKKQGIKVLKKGPYAKDVKFEDIKAEDLKEVYKVTELTKSEKMVTDTTGTHPEATTQWFITFTHNGNLAGFWTEKDPLKNIKTKKELAVFMAAGITQGDDEETNSHSSNDSKYAAKEESNLLIPKTSNGF